MILSIWWLPPRRSASVKVTLPSSTDSEIVGLRLHTGGAVGLRVGAGDRGVIEGGDEGLWVGAGDRDVTEGGEDGLRVGSTDPGEPLEEGMDKSSVGGTVYLVGKGDGDDAVVGEVPSTATVSVSALTLLFLSTRNATTIVRISNSRPTMIVRWYLLHHGSCWLLSPIGTALYTVTFALIIPPSPSSMGSSIYGLFDLWDSFL